MQAGLRVREGEGLFAKVRNEDITKHLQQNKKMHVGKNQWEGKLPPSGPMDGSHENT